MAAKRKRICVNGHDTARWGRTVNRRCRRCQQFNMRYRNLCANPRSIVHWEIRDEPTKPKTEIR